MAAPQPLPPGLGDVKTLLKRFSAAQARRQIWNGYLSRAFKFVAPNRDTFFHRTRADDRFKDVYDSTAVVASKRFVNSAQQSLMPAWREWSILRPGSDFEESEQADQIATILEKLTSDMFRHVNHSNFYQILPESLHDMTVTTGAIKIEEGDISDPFKCSAESISHVWLEEGPTGRIENVWRKPIIQFRNLERVYPDIQLPDQMAKKLKDSPELEPDLIEGTLFDVDSGETWAFVLTGSEKELIWTQDYGEGSGASPWVIFREDKVAGEVMGRGRALSALPDIMTANKMVEFELKNAALATAGAWTGLSDGVLNPYTAQVAPSVIIPVASNARQNPSLAPLERSGDFQVMNLVLTDIREAIKAAFLNTQRKPDDKVRTAFREGLDDRDLLIDQGAAFGRLQTELVDMTVRRFLRIMTNLGLAPEIRIDGREVTLKHNSPLSRAQDQSEILAISSFFETGIAAVGPDVMAQGVKVEEVPEALGKRFGVPQTLLRTEDEREEIQRKLVEVAQAAQAGEAPNPGA